jgi:outer membrane protein assembly factor BamB
LRRLISLFRTQRPLPKSALILALILVSFLLAGCSDIIGSSNWPGLSTDGEQLYVAYGGGVAAVNVENRSISWIFPNEDNATLQFYAPAAVDNGRLIVGDYGASQGFFTPGLKVSVYALQNNGAQMPTVLWTADDLATDRIIAPPLYVNGAVYVGTADNSLLALEAETGALRWQFKTSHSVWAQPVYANGILYVASLDKKLYALDAESGDEIWRKEFTGAIAGSPAINEGRIYIGSFDKKLYALDAQTGAEEWSTAANDWIWAAPVYADGSVYFADIDAYVYAYDAESGREQWRVTLPGTIQATPVIYEDTVIVVTADIENAAAQGAVVALDRATGAVRWQQTNRDPFYATPVIVADQLAVAVQSETDSLLFFNPVDGSLLWRLPPIER